ncbi:MAG: sulfurtransferase TusA family protein [Ectothiorhodospiraceae bacterium]|nr:sulfurtransferase TusA family protein [Ectothiorhodospiraceae bacterium]
MYELNLEGLSCPKPLYELQKFLLSDTRNDKFKVVCTDPNSIDDFESFCEFGVIKILSTSKIDNKLHFVIEKV